MLRVVYLVFNEGYSASTGADLLKLDLSAEAIRLARLLSELLPEPEVLGLLALLLLQDSRRSARITAEGDLIPLEEQDRGLWDWAAIAEGGALVRRALGTRRFAVAVAMRGGRFGARRAAARSGRPRPLPPGPGNQG